MASGWPSRRTSPISRDSPVTRFFPREPAARSTAASWRAPRWSEAPTGRCITPAGMGRRHRSGLRPAWTKSPTNPWLSANPSSSWESRSVDNADYVHTPADERIYYTGYDGVNGRIGLLTAATPGPGSAGGIEPILLELIVLVAAAAVGGVVIFVLFRMDSRGR